MRAHALVVAVVLLQHCSLTATGQSWRCPDTNDIESVNCTATEMQRACQNQIATWQSSGRHTEQDMCLFGGVYDGHEAECPASNSYRLQCEASRGKLCRVHYHGRVDGWADRCYPANCSGYSLDALVVSADPSIYEVECGYHDDWDGFVFVLFLYALVGAGFLVGFLVAVSCCAPKQVGWSSGLGRCFDDCGVCFLTCFCPCITFGNIGAYAMDSSSGMMNLVYIAASCMGVNQCLGIVAREAFRRKLGITGECLDDCCIHICAHACALCQEQRELDMIQSGRRIAVQQPTPMIINQTGFNGSMNPVVPMQPMQAQVVMVQCPPGAGPGTVIQSTSPAGGTMHVTVPAGVRAGQSFGVQMPATVVQATVVASAVASASAAHTDPWDGDESNINRAPIVQATVATQGTVYGTKMP